VANLEISFQVFFGIKFDSPHRVSAERMVSGTGLANDFGVLASANDKVQDKFLSAGDM
jgi:hypothetical protein